MVSILLFYHFLVLEEMFSVFGVYNHILTKFLYHLLVLEEMFSVFGVYNHILTFKFLIANK